MDKEIRDIWTQKAGNLIIPEVVLAFDRSNCRYFVIEDASTIVFLVKNATSTTYSIPKKYCILDPKTRVYHINAIEKLTVVSCPRKNDYELFVQKHLIK